MLYLGDRFAATDRKWLSEHKIGAIVNLARSDGVENVFANEMEYLAVDLLDADNPGDERANLLASLPRVRAFVDQAWARGKAVLVHCVQGKSRSVAMVLALLMEKERMPLKDVLEVVRSARPMIRPNNGFMRALIQYESQLFGSTTVAIEAYPAPILMHSG